MVVNYSEFLKNYVLKKFDDIDDKVLRDDLGIDEDTYMSAIKNKRVLSRKESKDVNKLIKRIKRYVDNDVLLRQILGKIMFISTYGKISVSEKCFIGSFIDENNNYCVEIYFPMDKISVYTKCNDSFSSVSYRNVIEGSVMRYEFVTQKNLEDESLVQKVSSKIEKHYNRHGMQVFEDSETVTDNYLNGVKEPLGESNVLRTQSWRVDGFVLIKSFDNSSCDDNLSYLVGIDDSFGGKEITCPATMHEASFDDVNLYTLGKISTDELWKHSKNKCRTLDINR